jgi:hypothetical protein
MAQGLWLAPARDICAANGTELAPEEGKDAFCYGEIMPFILLCPCDSQKEQPSVMRAKNLKLFGLALFYATSGIWAGGQASPPALLAATECKAIGAVAQGGICAGTGENAIIVTLQSSSTLFSWEGAASHCRGLTAAGFDDWELPTRQELLSLYAVRKKIGGFNATPYWSSTAFKDNNAWMVDFASGRDFVYPKTFTRPVRCVRRAK